MGRKEQINYSLLPLIERFKFILSPKVYPINDSHENGTRIGGMKIQ
jgi:hypothetical protein